jgi:hypothetical protein
MPAGQPRKQHDAGSAKQKKARNNRKGKWKRHAIDHCLKLGLDIDDNQHHIASMANFAANDNNHNLREELLRLGSLMWAEAGGAAPNDVNTVDDNGAQLTNAQNEAMTDEMAEVMIDVAAATLVAAEVVESEPAQQGTPSGQPAEQAQPAEQPAQEEPEPRETRAAKRQRAALVAAPAAAEDDMEYDDEGNEPANPDTPPCRSSAAAAAEEAEETRHDFGAEDKDGFRHGVNWLGVSKEEYEEREATRLKEAAAGEARKAALDHAEAETAAAGRRRRQEAVAAKGVHSAVSAGDGPIRATRAAVAARAVVTAKAAGGGPPYVEEVHHRSARRAGAVAAAAAANLAQEKQRRSSRRGQHAAASARDRAHVTAGHRAQAQDLPDNTDAAPVAMGGVGLCEDCRELPAVYGLPTFRPRWCWECQVLHNGTVPMTGQALSRLLMPNEPDNEIKDNPIRGMLLMTLTQRHRAVKIWTVKTPLPETERRAYQRVSGRINASADRHIHRQLLFWFLGMKSVYEFPTLSRKVEIDRRCAALGKRVDEVFVGTQAKPFHSEFLVYNSLHTAATQDAKFRRFGYDVMTTTLKTISAFNKVIKPILEAITQNPLRDAPPGTFGCPSEPTNMRAFYYGTCAAGTPDDPTSAYDAYPWLTQRGCLLHFLTAHLHPWAGLIRGRSCMSYASNRRVIFYVLLKEWMADPARHHDYQGARVCNAIFQVPVVPYTALA